MPAVFRKTLFLFLVAVFLIPSTLSASEPNEEQWVASVYERGKQAYDRGDYPGALEEWNKLQGTVDRYPAFGKMIGYLQGTTEKISKEDVLQVDQKLRELAQRRLAGADLQ